MYLVVALFNLGALVFNLAAWARTRRSLFVPCAVFSAFCLGWIGGLSYGISLYEWCVS